MYTPLSFLNDQALLHEIWTCSSKVRLKRYESFVSKCAEHPIHLSDAYAKNAFCYQPWGFFLQGSLAQPHLSQSKVWEWLDGAVDSTSTTYRSKLEKESVPSVGEEHLWSLGLKHFIPCLPSHHCPRVWLLCLGFMGGFMGGYVPFKGSLAHYLQVEP